MNIVRELLIIICLLIAIVVAHDFYISRNGVLRKIMIWLFGIEAFFWCIVLYYLFNNINTDFIKSVPFIIFIIMKACVKTRLWYWLKFRK